MSEQDLIRTIESLNNRGVWVPTQGSLNMTRRMNATKKRVQKHPKPSENRKKDSITITSNI